MMLRKLISFALLIKYATALINCSGQDSCYAESPECDPNRECQTVLRFDPFGNADIYVRNVSVTDYVSIVTHRDLLNTIEVFIWIPFYGQRLRGLGRTGQTILFNQQNLTNVVERLDESFFRCIINANELESDFRQNGNFVVARGKFQQFLKVNEGVKLYKVDQEDINGIEDDLKAENIIPLVYNIAAPIAKIDKSPFVWKEDPEVSKVLRNLENFVFHHAQNLRPLDIVEALNIRDRSDSLKKQRHQKKSKAENGHKISLQSTLVGKDVSKHQKVHKEQHMDSDKQNKNVLTNSTANQKGVETREHIGEDLDEKLYVRMTKRQMYSFVDGLENPDAPQNSTSTVLHDDDDEEVHVLMTKRQMYAFVDKQADRQVSDPKIMPIKRNYSERQLYAMFFLFIAVFYPFWQLLVDLF